MSAGTPPPPSPRAVAAARRVVGPARVLRAATRAGAVLAAVAGVVLWVELFARPLLRGPDRRAVVGAATTLVLLAVPAWWLRHASQAFADLVVLPERLETLHRQGRPGLTIESRDDLRRLRHGGLLRATRDVATTVKEIVDFVSPATTVVEVAAPLFWIATTVAGAATVLLVLAAVTVGPLVLLAG